VKDCWNEVPPIAHGKVGGKYVHNTIQGMKWMKERAAANQQIAGSFTFHCAIIAGIVHSGGAADADGRRLVL